MANETIITVRGNVTDVPELRYTQTGTAVANFTIAATSRHFDKTANEWVDDEPLFLRASVWREFAEQVAATLVKGTAVIATGRLKQRSYETKEGEKRTSIELEVEDIGPSLRFATAVVTKVQSSRTQSNNRERAGQAQAQDTWATTAPAVDYSDEVPF